MRNATDASIRCLECDRTAPYATTDDAALAGWERVERQPAGRHTLWMRCPECRAWTTYACSDLDAHGDSNRRRMNAPGDFTGMFIGKCAGTVYSMATGREHDCSCVCHIN